MFNNIKIYYKGYRKSLIQAVTAANKLLDSKDFYKKISQHACFEMSDITPKQVADLMEISDIRMSVDLYYALSPMTKAYGYDDHEHPTTIHINAWKLDRSIASICNTLVHACVHAVNAQHPTVHFSHDYDFDRDKTNTAPYWIGCLAQQMVAGDDTIVEYMQHEVNRDYVAAY